MKRPTPLARAVRMNRLREHHKRPPWDTADLTVRYLLYALGVADGAPSDADFERVYQPGNRTRSSYPEDARFTPLALARALAMLTDGREEEAFAFLGVEEHADDEGEVQSGDEAPPEGEADASTLDIDDPPEGGDAPRDLPDENGNVEAQDAPELQDSPAADVPLPDDFPMREELTDAGFTTTGSVRDASDRDLLDVRGVGEAKVSLIRAALAAAE